MGIIFLILAILAFVIGVIRIVRDKDILWGVILIVLAFFIVPLGNALVDLVQR